MSRRNPASSLVKATLLFTSMLTPMAGMSIAPALPLIQAYFVDLANVELWVRLVSTLPALFIAGTAPIAGYIVDKFGRKNVLVISTTVYGLSGVAGYFTSTLSILLLSRALLGISVGGLMTSVTTLIADYYVGADRARFMGLQAGFIGLGGASFLVLGGLLAETDWRAPFLVYLAAFVILPLIVLALYEPLPSEKYEEKPTPVSDPGGSVAESILAAGSDISAGPEDASVPIRLIIFVYTIMLGSQIIFNLIPVQIPFYLQEVIGASASQSGLAISVTAFFFALAAMQFGRIASLLDHISVLPPAFVLIGAGYLLISLGGGWPLIVLGLLLGGIGLGILIPNLIVWLVNETPPL